jgi:hypothetical protein
MSLKLRAWWKNLEMKKTLLTKIRGSRYKKGVVGA